MFVNLTALSKNIKSAYKHNTLKIGYIDGDILILTSELGLKFNVLYIPNKLKALLIEIAGKMPSSGVCIRLGKDYHDPLILEKDEADGMIRIFSKNNEAINKALKTNVTLSIYGHDVELFQKPGGEILGIKKELVDVIALGFVDIDVESMVTGPGVTGLDSNGVFWFNEYCVAVIMPYAIKKDNRVVAALERIDFFEDEIVQPER